MDARYTLSMQYVRSKRFWNRPSFSPVSTHQKYVFVWRGASGEAVPLQDRDDELAFHSKHNIPRPRNQVHEVVEPIPWLWIGPRFRLQRPIRIVGNLVRNHPGEGKKRVGSIWVLCIMYDTITPLPLFIQEGSDQGRHGLPNEPEACWQTSAVYRWDTAAVETLLRRPRKNASAVSHLCTQIVLLSSSTSYAFVLMVCCRALLQVQSMQGW